MLKCKDCQEEYEADTMKYGLCEDCLDNFQSNDLEYQIEKAMYLHDEKATPPSTPNAKG